jgi:outer membrane lipoprotein SlyB
MAGTIEGGRKAREKNLASDPDFYKRIGQIGGSRGTTGGYASEVVGDDGLTGRQRARVSGAIGGRVSRRMKEDVALSL